MGNIETTTKFARLKSISSIEDSYLEAATGGVLQKKLFLKVSQYSQENKCVSLFLIKLQVFSPASLLKRDSNTGVFLWILQIF